MSALDPHVYRDQRHHYRFESTWRIASDASTVFAVLSDPLKYPDWWPGFLYAEELADGYGRMALKSVLPMTLRFELKREIEDAKSLTLRAHVTGDIEGTVQWSVGMAAGGLAEAKFLQTVELKHRLARPVDPVLRPILEWNHSVAMRRGVDGLKAKLGTRAEIQE